MSIVESFQIGGWRDFQQPNDNQDMNSMNCKLVTSHND